MSRYLRTNTATRVTVGPFLDKGDGITPEVALTATNEHLTLMVDDAGVPTLVLDANATASGGNNDMVHVTNDDAGFYDLELTAAQTNYVGRAMLSINYVTDHLPVFHEFMIMSAQAYDAMFGTGNFSADVIAISGDTTAADNCELMFDGTGYAGGTTKLDVNTATISNNAITANAINTGAITNAKFAAGAIDAAAIANAAIDAATFAADMDGEIATIVWNAATASYGGVGTYGQAVEDILTDTGTTLDGRIPSALVGGKMDSHVNDIAANAITAASIAADAITAAKIADAAIDFATFAADCKTGTGLKANVESITADAITAASIAAGAIDNATLAADVGSTAFATNIMAQAVFKALDSAIGDGVSLTADGLLDKIRTIGWIVRNKIEVTDTTGDTVIYKDNGSTEAFNVAAALTDDVTTTTRKRMA